MFSAAAASFCLFWKSARDRNEKLKGFWVEPKEKYVSWHRRRRAELTNKIHRLGNQSGIPKKLFKLGGLAESKSKIENQSFGGRWGIYAHAQFVKLNQFVQWGCADLPMKRFTRRVDNLTRGPLPTPRYWNHLFVGNIFVNQKLLKESL